MKGLSGKSIVLLALMLMSGCAAFKGNNLSDLSRTDLQVGKASKIKIFYENRIDTSANVSDKKLRKALDEQRQQFFAQLSRSGCCELVKEKEEADLLITATCGSHASNAALIGAFITGYSLYTIPSWVTPKLSFVVDVDAPDMTSHHYEYRDQYTMVQWLPMLLAAPFANPMSVEEKIQTNMYRHLIADLEQDGLLMSRNTVSSSNSARPAPRTVNSNSAFVPSATDRQPAPVRVAERQPEPESGRSILGIDAARRIAVQNGCSSEVSLDYQSEGGSMYSSACRGESRAKIICDQYRCRMME